MKKVLISLMLVTAFTACAHDAADSPVVNPNNPEAEQQKKVYIPDSLKPYNLDNKQERWCWKHSAQTPNVVYFWEKPFGDNLQNPPRLQGQPMSFDLDNLKKQVEKFYVFFRDTLKFSLPGSICDRYKMMVMVNYSLDGTAYGGTYDDFIGALWVTPNRIQDQKLNCLAHELGHSFQLQIMADKAGEAWGGSGFFEMTSQWMLWRVNPDWITDELYHFEAFRNLTHKGYLHLDNIYHSPYVIEWWAEKHGLESIAQLYREGKEGEDPVVTYKRKYQMSQEQFNDDIFDCYRHLVNFDFDYARKETRPYACTFDTKMEQQADGWMMPDTALIPENYGFNAIRLEAPKPGKKMTVEFQALASDKVQTDATLGYRYGLVGITADTDECIYSSVESAQKGKASLDTPKNQTLKAVYLVVMGAPTEHSLDPSSRRFPYQVKVK